MNHLQSNGAVTMKNLRLISITTINTQIPTTMSKSQAHISAINTSTSQLKNTIPMSLPQFNGQHIMRKPETDLYYYDEPTQAYYQE